MKLWAQIDPVVGASLTPNKQTNDTIVNQYIAAVVGPTPLRANQACPTVAACFTVLEAK